MKNQEWKRENLFLVGHIRKKKKKEKSYVSINKCIKLKEQQKQCGQTRRFKSLCDWEMCKRERNHKTFQGVLEALIILKKKIRARRNYKSDLQDIFRRNSKYSLNRQVQILVHSNDCKFRIMLLKSIYLLQIYTE